MYVGKQSATNFRSTCPDDGSPATVQSPSSDPRKQRQEIRRIAGAVDGELRTLKGFGMFTRDVDKLDTILDRLKTQKERLAGLRSSGLDHAAPPASVAGKAASTALVAMAVPTRVAATVVAGVVAAPLTCTCNPMTTARVFHAIDQLPRARAWAQRQTMSTGELAQTVAQSLRKATDKAAEKRAMAGFFARAPKELMGAVQEMQAELDQAADTGWHHA